MPRPRLNILLAVFLLGGVALAGCGSDAPSGAVEVLPARTIAAGSVDVTIRPVTVDATGAVFSISFETHTVELELDVAQVARLEVDGRDWEPGVWTGDAPGGHHRSGELSFRAGGPARGETVLTIDGLPGPVLATWTLGSTDTAQRDAR